MQENNIAQKTPLHICSLAFDASTIQSQVDELAGLLKSSFPKGVPNDLVGNLAGLVLDVILSDSRTTLGADGTIEILYGLRLGSGFERLRAAVLADEWNIHNELSLSQSGKIEVK